MIVYADFTCPRCAVAAERLREAPVRTSSAISRSARATRARCRWPMLLEAAARQDAFWQLHDAVYGDQGRIDDPHIWEHAERLGLDVDRLEADRRDPDVAERVERDVRSALRAGAATTPTLVIDGALHQGARPSFAPARGRCDACSASAGLPRRAQRPRRESAAAARMNGVRIPRYMYKRAAGSEGGSERRSTTS